MRITRVPYCTKVKFVSVKMTRVGANKRLENYLGETLTILKFHNLHNSINNVYVQAKDGYCFWCNYKDLKDIELGLSMNINKLEREMKKSTGINLDRDLYNTIFRIIWEIEYCNLKFDIMQDNICTRYKINKNILMEIYFLFYFNKLKGK